MFENLSNNIVENLGDILTEGWSIKKKLAKGVSNPKIDEWLQEALNVGAQGGKICGAGGGGFLLLYIEDDYLQAVKKALSDLMHEQVSFCSFGSRVIEVF